MKKLLLVCLAACLGWGQAPTFDEAVIRPNLSPTSGGTGSLRGGRLVLPNVTLKTLLMMAYQVKPYQVIGGPKWMGTDQFDVEAKTQKNITFAEANPMVQTLLADRFQVQLHREMRELPVYNLVPAKGGSRMKSAAMPGYFRNARGLIQSNGTTTKILADLISGAVGVPVLDRTGLEGLFEFKLQWAPDDSQPNAANADVSAFDPTGPSIFTAVQEQLGLRLESTKAPVEVLVIDRAEKPSEN